MAHGCYCRCHCTLLLPAATATVAAPYPRHPCHSLFWPDAWTGQASRGIMEVYGIDAEKAEVGMRVPACHMCVYVS